ncbi:Peptidylglycine alpha-hydroxylating monooxygenase [Eumeta japonica]|uniref:Peptidylglycine alpha-hydroxylating monooxygenase n=1 Tax=Eumeta variegata TaxID=151549 RepID=A0A4C1VVW9_EUMVA|nr:Peptidylglycine alpha-hydroxylating monooxygenase [Eumeta japonica]
MPRQAGVFLLGTSGIIPPNQVEHMETACTIHEYKVLHPFAFRTHTHALGSPPALAHTGGSEGFAIGCRSRHNFPRNIGRRFLPYKAMNLFLGRVLGKCRVQPKPVARSLRQHPCKVVSGYVVRRSLNGDKWQLLGKKDPQLPQMFYPVRDQSPISYGDVLAARCTMNNTLNYPVPIGATNKDEMCNFYLMYWVENDTPMAQKYCFSPGPPYYYWNYAPENFNRIPDFEASTL